MSEQQLNSRGTPVQEKTSVELARFKDKYGEEQTIHRTHNGLSVRQGRSTPILQLNPHIARSMGRRITALRQARGLTLKQLANACGMVSGDPKSRMWEIEKGTRGQGIRLGTLYAIAIALNVEAWQILPTASEVREIADAEGIEINVLAVGDDAPFSGAASSKASPEQ